MREIRDETFEQDVLRAGRPVAVDFWAPWCSPCRAVTTVLEELAAETEKIEFVKVNIDENFVTASRYDVLSIPTVIVFSDGAPAETVVGAYPAAHFRTKLARFL